MWVFATCIFLLTTVVLTTASNRGNCTRDGSGFRCDGINESLTEAFKGQNCREGILKLNITVESASMDTNGSKGCAKLRYDISCSTLEEKFRNGLKKEMCRVYGKNISRTAPNDMRHLNFSERSHFELGDVSITAVGGTESMLIATSQSVGGNVSMVDKNGELLGRYDRFYISPGSIITFLQNVEEDTANSSVRFKMTLRMNEEPLSFLPSNLRIIDLERKCSFLRENISDKWDDSECTTNASSDRETICSCTHNSAFVVVFAVQTVEIAPQLIWASTGLEIASMVALLMAAILLGLHRDKMGNFDRVLIQISLCIALMLTHLFFIIGSYATSIRFICRSVAVVSHYFLVVTAVLMVMEGSVMLLRVLAPLSFEGNRKKLRRAVGFSIAWGLPLIYVTICSVVGFGNDNDDTQTNYIRFWKERGSYDYCWINPIYGAVVIVPVALAIAINTVIAIKLAIVVWQMSKSAEEFKPMHQRNMDNPTHAGNALRAVFILMPILGIPWIIGFLVNTPKPFAMIFATMHVIVNSLQGVMLFLHYVPFNSKMRKQLKQSWKNTITSMATATPTVHFVSTSHSVSH